LNVNFLDGTALFFVGHLVHFGVSKALENQRSPSLSSVYVGIHLSWSQTCHKWPFKRS